MIGSSISPVATKKGGFEDIFEAAIVDSIRDLLGESSMRAIVFHLNLERVAGDPQVLHEKLHELLSGPAAIVEEIIIKDLFRRLDLLFVPRGTFDFQRYADVARDVFAQNAMKGNR